MQNLYPGIMNVTFTRPRWDTQGVVTSVARDQELSKALFGSAHMHAVIVAISEIDANDFSAPQIMELTGLAASSVHALITRLLRAGLIAKSGGLPGERTVLYRREETNALEALARLGNRVA